MANRHLSLLAFVGVLGGGRARYASGRGVICKEKSGHNPCANHHRSLTLWPATIYACFAKTLVESGATCVAYETLTSPHGRLPLLAAVLGKPVGNKIMRFFCYG